MKLSLSPPPYADAPVVVLISGLGGSGSYWLPQLAVLEQEYQATFGKKLTIRRLGAIISNPRMPVLGADLEYDEHLSPSQYVESDIRKAQRLSLYRECELEE